MYLTPKKINAALKRAKSCENSLGALLLDLECTRSPASTAETEAALHWNIYTGDGVWAFTGNARAVNKWLRNSDPTCTFTELSPMRRDRLVAAFVSPGRDLLGDHRIFAREQGATSRGRLDEFSTEIVAGIWNFARLAGWSYLKTLSSPASVASEALGHWRSQHVSDGWGDDRSDDPGAYDG